MISNCDHCIPNFKHLTGSKVNVLIVYLVNVSILHLFLRSQTIKSHMATLPPGVADGQDDPCKSSISEYHKSSQITYLNFYFPKQNFFILL